MQPFQKPSFYADPSSLSATRDLIWRGALRSRRVGLPACAAAGHFRFRHKLQRYSGSRKTHLRKARPRKNRAPTVQMRKAQKRKASNLTIQRFSFGALAGTRIPGHLIKKTFQATFVKSALLKTSSFSIHYHNFTLVALCILCIPCIALHP